MEFEIIGYIGAVIVGLALGLMGGGGSILTVPIFVYIFGIEASSTAPAYSLFVVGVASTIGASIKLKQGFVDLHTGTVFGLPAMLAVFVTRRYIVPAIPDEIFSIDSFILSKRVFVMGLFAVLMILASITMIKGRRVRAQKDENKFNYPLVIIEGSIVGVLCGLVGAGGGFIIIPSLILLSNLPMKKAVGTSLGIISINSIFGFIGGLQETEINWTLLLTFTSLAVLGIFIGNRLSHKVNGPKLKRFFGWFVLVMGTFIFIKEILLN